MSVAPEQIASLERKVGTQARSPLFVQLAAYYLEAERPKDALRVCDSGLANHPFYATGHLVKGRALVALNMRAEARREFELVLEWLPGNAAVRALLRSVPPSAEETLSVPAMPEPVAYHAPEPTPVEQPTEELPPEPVVEAEPSPEPEPAPEPEPEPEPLRISYTEMPPEPAPASEPEPDFVPRPVYDETETHAEPGEHEAAVSDEASRTAFDEYHTFQPDRSPDVPPAAEEPPPPSSFEAVTFQAEPSPDPFGFGIPSGPSTETTVDTPAPEAPPAFGGFDVPADTSAFLAGIPQPEPEPSGIPSPEARGDEQGGGDGFQGPGYVFSGPADEDTFDKYALRMRAELSGEDTMTLDDYFSGREPVLAPPPEPAVFPTPKKDKIEELTEKLQGAKRITPVINFAQKSTAAASEQDTPTSTGFVTPTLAEIYAKQGWYDDAIRAYRTLAITKPADKDRFERRIGELEELKKRSGG